MIVHLVFSFPVLKYRIGFEYLTKFDRFRFGYLDSVFSSIILIFSFVWKAKNRVTSKIILSVI